MPSTHYVNQLPKYTNSQKRMLCCHIWRADTNSRNTKFIYWRPNCGNCWSRQVLSLYNYIETH
jgi:hypothetical protein